MQDQKIIQGFKNQNQMLAIIARDLAKLQVAYNSLFKYLKTIEVKDGVFGTKKLIDEKALEEEFKKEWKIMEEQAKAAAFKEQIKV